MRRLLKFLHLSHTQRRLWLQTFALLWAIRLGLWLLPFAVVRRALTRLGRHAASHRLSLNELSHALTVLQRYVPFSTCLVQALTAHILLLRHGERAALHLGVTKTGVQHLQAHAWVECRGRVLVGELADLSRYTPLPCSEELF